MRGSNRAAFTFPLVRAGIMDGKPFGVDVSDLDGVHVVELRGELDVATASGLADRLVRIAGSVVVVDLKGLSFLDASGLAALLEARERIIAQGDQLKLRGARAVVRRVFEATDLTSLLSD